MGGKKRGSDRPKVKYHVVSRPYDDKDFETDPLVLVEKKAPRQPREEQPEEEHGAEEAGHRELAAGLAGGSRHSKAKKRAVSFNVEDMEYDETIDFANLGDAPLDGKMNMNVVDDTIATGDGEERMFTDFDEMDFDQDFIQDMMQGGDEQYDEVPDDKYPKRGATSAQDRQFDRMMKEFNRDEEIDEDDPRVQGPLGIESYSAQLQDFMVNHSGFDIADGAPIRHKGLINQLNEMARQNRIFDSNENGEFVTMMRMPHKTEAYYNDMQGLREMTKKQLMRGEIDTEDILYSKVTEPTVTIEVKKKPEYDCETIQSTYTTLYNHPTVIGASKKAIKAPRNMAQAKRVLADHKTTRAASMDDLHEADRPAKKGGVAFTSPSSGSSHSSDEDDDGAITHGTDMMLPFDLSERPTDESPEEKKLRRKYIKEMRRENRQKKKDMKITYRAVGVAHTYENVGKKQQKASSSLSMAARM